MKIIRNALIACLLSLVSVAAQADILQGVLAQTYGSGGQTTGWVTQAQLAGFLSTQPTSWSGQTYDCSVNTCLNFPQAPAFSVGTPTARTLSLSTAYQGTTSTKSAHVTVNLTSTATLNLGGGTTNTAIVVMGPTTAVASGTGTTIGTYTNSQTGTIVVGVGINAVLSLPIAFDLPTGWYFAVIQQTGSVTINSAFDQSLG